MSGLFSTFNVAKRGMAVQQRAIDVTSHNIANTATPGYSRQRVKIETTRAMSMNGVNAGQIGTGAQVSAIERVRDSFLDYQVRGESSVLGQFDTRAKFLGEVEGIFNEPSDTGVSSLMGKFFDAFQELSKQPNSSNARTVVAQQTEALANALNSTYTSLEKLQTNAKELTRSGVTNTNSLINQIDKLNQEIINVSVSGNMPNDLMDKRDLLVDELSYKMNIVVENKGFNGIDIRPADIGLVKGGYIVNSDPNSEVSRFSYISSVVKDETKADGSYIITYYKNGDMDKSENKQTLVVTGLTEQEAAEIETAGILWANKDGQAIRPDGFAIPDGELVVKNQMSIFTPESGELKGVVSVQADIQKYMDELNRLAKALAFSVNAVHSGSTDPLTNTDNIPFFVNGDVATYNYNGTLGNLDTTLFAEEQITAKNITINKEILNDVMKINAKADLANGEGDGQRALAIAKLRDCLIRVQDINGIVYSRKDLFDKDKGGNTLADDNMTVINSYSGMKIDAYFKDTVDRLGVQSQEATRMVANQESLLYSLEESRLSVSGVSLDEEMANLVQFQHAYNANAKIISTLDELLDVVVNGLKR